MSISSYTFRDLKLENILLGADGHIQLTDFGLSKKEEEEEEEGVIVGTLEYISPEVIIGRRHSYAADWWSYGLVLFEMLCGYHPFYCENQDELFERILNLKIELPDFVGEEMADFLARLLIRNPAQRLGSGPLGNKEIQNHGFLSHIDFGLLFRKALKPPFAPHLSSDLDTRFFDDEFTNEEPVLTPTSGSIENLPYGK